MACFYLKAGHFRFIDYEMMTLMTHPMPNKTAQLFIRVIEILCIVFAFLGGALFVIEALMTFTSVVGRTFFNRPIAGDYELVQMLSAMGIVLCLPYCQLQFGHVFVDFFTLWAPTLLKRILDMFAAALMSVFGFFIAWRVWHGMQDMIDYQETSMVLRLPLWWTYIPMVPSFVLLGISSILTIFILAKKEY
ncbi:hypothetical protein GCM10026986_13890 [Nitrincola alkalisediminis]